MSNEITRREALKGAAAVTAAAALAPLGALAATASPVPPAPVIEDLPWVYEIIPGHWHIQYLRSKEEIDAT